MNQETNQEQELALKLAENHAAVKRLLGHRWIPRVTELRPVIAGYMRRAKTTNHLEAVLPVAKMMAAAGHAPNLLLAVAVELSTMPTPPGWSADCSVPALNFPSPPEGNGQPFDTLKPLPGHPEEKNP